MADLDVADGLRRNLPDDQRAAELLRAIERALDVLDLADVVGSAAAARAELAGVLATPCRARSDTRSRPSGHAHIDSAWLWPVRETVRKVARTVANVVQLMDTDDSLVYAMSSAQQWAWLESSYPELFTRVRAYVDEGRFVPVGGMWVESDTNLVGGEAMARQFVVGKRWFAEHLGVEPHGGVAAGLVRLHRGAPPDRQPGRDAVVPDPEDLVEHHQPLPPPHVLVGGHRRHPRLHPLPARSTPTTPSSPVPSSRTPPRTSATRASRRGPLAPFGYGDGGGGPTREMLGRARRTADLAGSPRVRVETPEAFFTAAEEEYAVEAPVWTGELYLEIHRGTYTSQAAMKDGNRRCEHLLREAELWSATADVRGLLDYPYDELRAAWETVLLHQFHDILPGSSIAWVHREARATYARVMRDLEALIDRALDALAGDGDEPIAFNAAPIGRIDVPALGGATPAEDRLASTARMSDDGGAVLQSDRFRVTVDAAGIIRSIRDLRHDREVLPPGGAANLLELHPDHPNRWDAWDLDAHYRHQVVPLTDVDELSVEGDAVVVRRSFGASAVEQRIALHLGRIEIDTEVDWHESEKVLKLSGRLRRACRRGALRDAVRPRGPAHARQHQLGRRSLRGLRPSLGAGVGGGVRRRARQPHDVRPRRHAPPTGRRRDVLTDPRQPAPRSALPRSRHRPGPARVPARDRARRPGRRRGTRRLRPESPAAPPTRADGRAARARRGRHCLRRSGQARRGRLR